jgi:hypothetical protein
MPPGYKKLSIHSRDAALQHISTSGGLTVQRWNMACPCLPEEVLAGFKV